MLCQQGGQNLQLPTIVPPSPAAQNFMRYGEIPVDYSTGVPKIEIPIYTIQGKKLSLPISISYHASGIKVYDVPSEVGLGWVLNAGGIVTRTMLDNKDEAGAPTKTYSNAEQFLNAIPGIVYGDYNSFCYTYPGVHTMEMYLNANPSEDFMSDRYFYSLPNGISGVFRHNYPQFDSLIMLPYRPYKIDGPNNGVFKITDDKGVLYTFQKFQDSSYGSSEWFLKEMTSADGAETIKLTYIPQQSIPNGMPSDSFYTERQYSIQACNISTGEPGTTMGGTGGGTYSVTLATIESDDTLITFSYSDREDSPYLKKISEIKIASKNEPNNIKKKITFDQSYFGTVGYENTNNRDKRLKLNALNIYGETNLNPQVYSFNYEQSVMLPSYNSRSFDFWGYYNGSNNGTAIPNNFVSPQYPAGHSGNRKADNGYFSKACMLTNITYPAGGKTKFDFERGYVDALYRGIDGGGYIGGFRVSKITNYSKDNVLANMKSYQYGSPKFNIIDPEFYKYPQYYIDVEDPNGDFVPCQGTGGCWLLYQKDITTSNPIVSHDLTPGMPIAYTDVTEYDGTINDHVGLTKYHYSSPDQISYTDLLRELHTYQEDRGNYEPKLGYKLVKSKTGSKLSEEIFYYADYFEQEFTTGINISRTLTNLANLKHADLTDYGCHGCPMRYVQSIKAHDTKAFQKATLLNYTIKRTYNQYDENKYVEERVDYNIYNQHNLMAKEMTRTNSLGDNILTQYKYPYDFGSSEPYQTLLAKNILTPVIEQTTTNTSKSKQIQKVHTDYKNWGDNIIEPELIKAQAETSSTLEDRIRFMTYDKKGNVTSLKKEGNIPITYLWGYDKNLPIAMVENSNLVSQAGTVDESKYINSMLPPIPMGSTNYELGSFIITEEKNYKIDRTYEQIPNDKSVMYNILFENLSNSNYSAYFTDTTPPGGNSHTFTTQSQLLKPGTYKVKLTNVGYNGYQGSIEHQFNFTIYNTVNIDKAIPFHTSFEEDVENVSTTQAKTGKKSHTGQYYVKIPQASLGYDKVIVSYWGKASDTSAWEYVENVVNANGQDYYIGGAYYYIDEVRMYPVGALMTTYTYDPFYKQPTSIMKSNNDCEFYKYDNFGRLIDVRDENGNLLKEYQYHFKP